MREVQEAVVVCRAPTRRAFKRRNSSHAAVVADPRLLTSRTARSRPSHEAGREEEIRMAVRWMLGAVAVAVVALAVFAGTAQASGGSFTGAWAASDTDGDLVLLEISGAGGQGLRRVTLFDRSAVVCGGESANAHGAGTVVGDTLTATLDVVCHGTVVFTGEFHFTLVGGTIVSDTAPMPYTRR